MLLLYSLLNEENQVKV